MLIDARLKTISDLLSSQASNHKEQPYLLYQPTGQEISYQALDRLTLKTAELLLELGMAKGDRVGLMLDNSIEFLLAYLGVLRTGGVIVPVNPTSRPTEIYNVLSHCKAKTFITDTKHLADLSDLRSVLPTLDHIILSKDGFFEVPDRTTTLSSTLEMAALPTVGLDDPAVILYTSGTTGQPKGVVLTQLNLVVNACDISEALQLDNARMMCVLPLHHTNGQVINVLAPLVSGGSVVLCGSYSTLNLARFWETVSHYQVNVIDVVPTILVLLLKLKSKKQEDISSLSYIICGAAPLTIELQREFEARFGCIVVQEYGLTEATCVSSINSLSRRKLGSIGLPLAANEMKIVNPVGTEILPGEIGEIIIRGENVMQGYYEHPDLTRGVIREGWLHTGDLGLVDEDGFFYIKGRSKDIIIKGGENIYPLDVESTLCSHSAVAECAVVGIPDSIYGEAVKAYVVTKEGVQVTEDELITICKDALLPFWCPKVIEFVDYLPKTPSGKVIKAKL